MKADPVHLKCGGAPVDFRQVDYVWDGADMRREPFQDTDDEGNPRVTFKSKPLPGVFVHIAKNAEGTNIILKPARGTVHFFPDPDAELIRLAVGKENVGKQAPNLKEI